MLSQINTDGSFLRFVQTQTLFVSPILLAKLAQVGSLYAVAKTSIII